MYRALNFTIDFTLLCFIVTADLSAELFADPSLRLLYGLSRTPPEAICPEAARFGFGELSLNRLDLLMKISSGAGRSTREEQTEHKLKRAHCGVSLCKQKIAYHLRCQNGLLFA